ncbi:MAG: hypothetical protein KGJ97_12105 [Xanthomonadaceae bacterium]|jgi:hypothetical protein|nr:hypothetical protein [Xanthomonadaceae bacterium]MDE3071348.1 hypothetical protein [Pseudomonadota bacterium]
MQNQEGTSRYVFRDGDCYWVKPQDIKPTDVDCTDMDSAEFMAFFFSQRKAGNPGQRNAAPARPEPQAAA